MRVLLVDDEILTIRMLQNIIHWREMGLELIGYAQDGQEALEKVLKEKPDIVVSDIKMPGMNGLEFLRKINDLSLGIKTILVSAYADFSYVKEAMKLGGCDYILKPIDEVELEQALKKEVVNIQGQKEQERIVTNSVKQLDKINLYHFMRTNQGLSKVLKLNNGFRMGNYSVFMIRIDSITIDEYNNSNNMEMVRGGYIVKILENIFSVYSAEYYIYDYEDGVWTIILEEILNRSRDEIAKEIVNKVQALAEVHVNVYFSSPGNAIKDLPVLYEEVKNLRKYSFYIGEEDVLGYGYNCNKKELDEVREIGIVKDIEKAISNKDTDGARKILNEAFELMPVINPQNKKFIYDLCHQTIMFIHKYMPENGKSSKNYQKLSELTYEELTSIDSLNDLKRTMIGIIEEIPDLMGNQRMKSYSKPVEEGINLINEKYNHNLSLEEICSEIAISKNYFCYLFKRETGMSLWNYLTEIRLQHAKKLLENTDLRSYEIAFQVGYDNPSYFSKLFKKYELISPNEYRENKR